MVGVLLCGKASEGGIEYLFKLAVVVVQLILMIDVRVQMIVNTCDSLHAQSLQTLINYACASQGQNTSIVLLTFSVTKRNKNADHQT